MTFDFILYFLKGEYVKTTIVQADGTEVDCDDKGELERTLIIKTLEQIYEINKSKKVTAPIVIRPVELIIVITTNKTLEITFLTLKERGESDFTITLWTSPGKYRLNSALGKTIKNSLLKKIL